MKKGLTRVLVLLMILGIYVAFPQNGFSETAIDKTATYTLGEIVVRGERAGVESIGTVRDITAADIERRHVQTLDKALELLPGLEIRTGARSRHRLESPGVPGG